MSLKLSIKRRVNRCLRFCLRKKEARIHGIVVPLALIPDGQALKELDRGTYEDAEAALIARHFTPGATVIELGASLGIISAVIGRTNPARLLCVEAIPEFAEVVRAMLARNCPQVPHEVIACAIATSDGVISFAPAGDDTFTGRVATAPAANGTIQVPARRLSTLLAQLRVTAPFHLVCDIEGMEVPMFLEDAGALAGCAGLILEAHPTNHQGREFTPDAVFELCQSLGFEMIERRRNAAYLTKKISS